MKPLRPILRENPNERVRALLSSARLDVPPSDWTQRALLAMVPAAGLPETSNVADLAVDDGASATATLAPKPATAIAAKWAAIGAIAGGSLSATIMHAVDKRPESHTALVARAYQQVTADTRRDPEALLHAAREDSQERAAAPEPTIEREADPAAVTQSQPGYSTTHATPRARLFPTGIVMNRKQKPHGAEATNDLPPRTAPTTSLGEEVRSLHRIRQISLERGAVVALDELDRHERQYATPSLGIEAAVLRIDLLWSAGQKSAAQALTQQFLSVHPDCPHTEHVRALLSQNAGHRTRLQPSTVEETVK